MSPKMQAMKWLGSAERYAEDSSLRNVLRELSCRLAILPMSILRPHESIDPKLVNELMEDIRLRGHLRKPILVDLETLIIIDGHHRVEALRRLGCRKVPCLLVDYRSPRITALRWKGGEKLSKSLILKASLSGDLMPPKTTRHIITLCNKRIHVSEIQFNLNIPYQKLM